MNIFKDITLCVQTECKFHSKKCRRGVLYRKYVQLNEPDLVAKMTAPTKQNEECDIFYSMD